jgi:methylmalonyl-CoA mutase C-terminal domain/subunit
MDASLKAFNSQGNSAMESKKAIRVLIAKPGLDGHDRGALIIAMSLRNAGMEVVYTGLHQPIDQIAEAAIEEDVDVIGLSILSGAHIALVGKLMKILKDSKANDKKVVIGGTIPKQDIPALMALGVKAVFPVGSPLPNITDRIRELMEIGPD